MASFYRFLLLADAIFSLLAAVRGDNNVSYPTPACRQLKNRYRNQTSYPGSNDYVAGVAENWSESCVLQSYCLFEPTCATDVAGALTILTATNTKFAVRGGGHMPVPGAAGVSDGVLISTEKMNLMQLTNNGEMAQLGPGLRWGVVYDWIAQYNLGVAGGRYGPVGVSGVLLGGGINFFGSQFGWSSDRVSNFEVVLANSSIVNANTGTNPDLFWALKGGSSNFGIVTRFDVKTFPVTSVYGGTTIYEPQSVTEYLDAIANYVVPGGGSDDILASINPTLQINVSTGIFTINTLSSHVGRDPNPAAFANFTKIPAYFSDNSVRPNFSAFTDETSSPIYSQRSNRWLFASTALKGTSEAVYLTNKTFFDTLASMPALKDITGLLLGSTQQTITKAWLTAAQASGGDAIDLDPANGNFIGKPNSWARADNTSAKEGSAYLIYAKWDNASDDQLINRFARQCIANTNAAAQSAGLDYPFVYINDALGSEDIFSLYGGGKSLPKMQAIAKRYDPNGVFQRLMPGGFKIFPK